MKDEPNFDEFDQRSIDTILEYGHQVIMVFPTQDSQGVGFAYTVGRAIKDLPELLMTGNLAPNAMGAILNDAVRLHEEGKCLLEDGYCYPPNTLLQGGFTARVIEVNPRDSEMFQAINLMGEHIRALQIVWPDKNGRFPGDPDYAFPEDAQPIRRKS